MRYLPLTDADRKAMLGKIGISNIDALFATVPKDKLLGGLLDLPKGKSELEVERSMGRLAAQNTPADRCLSSSAPVPISITCRRASIT